MAGEITPLDGWRNELSMSDPAALIDGVLIGNFAGRGESAAKLVVASLTESSYEPTIGGTRFGIKVSERFLPSDYEYADVMPQDDETTDTVDIAAQVLRDLIDARVSGSRRLYLDTYRTHYRGLLRRLKPGLRTSGPHLAAFEESFVYSLRSRDVPVRNPGQGYALVTHAPRSISGLRLSDTSKYDRGSRHDMVTSDGRLVRLDGKQDIFSPPKYWLPTDTGEIDFRGGSAPSLSTVHRLQARAIALRTARTER